MTTKTDKVPIITIGADPEVFVRDLRRNSFVSAHPYVKGTKDNPEPWKGGAIQVDGVALEFNIIPTKNARDFSNSITNSLHYLQGILTGYDSKLKITPTPTAFFDEKYFDMLPEEVKALGCQPDYNAYSLDVNPKPETKLPMRTGSGHVHVGFIPNNRLVNDVLSPEHMDLCAGLVKQLDIALFIPSLIFDKDKQRRTLYGAPGAFRPKPYGVEYRVLSNRWLRNAALQTWVFNSTLKATRDFFRGNIYSEKVNQDEYREIFNKLDSKYITRLARDFARHNPRFASIPRGYDNHHGSSNSNNRTSIAS